MRGRPVLVLLGRLLYMYYKHAAQASAVKGGCASSTTTRPLSCQRQKDAEADDCGAQHKHLTFAVVR